MAEGFLWAKNADDAWEETDPASLSLSDMTVVRKSITFASTSGTQTLFTVTGEVLIRFILPFCPGADVVGGTSLALGVTGSTSLFIAATTSTAIDTDEFWFTTTPTGNGEAVPAALKDIAIEEDIILTLVGTITSGTVEFTVFYQPISSDGAVTAA